MNEVLFTFNFMVDDIDVKIFLLELVFRGGECSVASSRRLYKTPSAVPHHVARDQGSAESGSTNHSKLKPAAMRMSGRRNIN